MKEIFFILIFGVFYGCKNTQDEILPQNNLKTDSNIVSKFVCPCDSVGFFETKGKLETYCYIGKSLIKIAHFPTSDTMDVRRYSLFDGKLDEAITVLNNKITTPEYSLLCDVKDSLNFFKLTFISNEAMFESQGVITHSVLGVQFVVNNDTIKSNTTSVLVPKEKMEGEVKIEKITDVTHTNKGYRRKERQPIFLEAEKVIKYGSLLEQYKAIKQNCDFSNANYIK